ncbi:phage tail family protein [Streptomyces sp. NBC_01142]|uniref:phage distal tail protein n=1 Tax=Streptomyces sp. NBC_01142 TaxID=2975865 RepID=UPI0022539E33|nr:phage tail domain-containing protein [Streptomyces sp. NBC_01142]MCX4818357.1 phage tail family protein [Streptomyces sp. NBC_01142]
MAAGDLVTAPGHIQFGDLLLGPGTPYRWKNLPGWEDSPAVDSGTVNRSDAHGAYLGRLLAQPRTITLDDIVIRTEPRRMGAAVRALRAATALRDDEQPLVVQLDDELPLLSFARCMRRSIPVGVGGYAIGIVQGAALQFEATDPRRYSLVEQQVEAQLPSAEPGLDWQVPPGPERLLYPINFGAPGSTGSLLAVNEGDAPAHPVIAIRGPLSLPSVTNLATGEAIEYDIDLALDDELVIDTREGTVTLNATAARLYTVTARSVPETLFTLTPGTTSLLFRSAPGATDPRASCSIRWRSAHW